MSSTVNVTQHSVMAAPPPLTPNPHLGGAFGKGLVTEERGQNVSLLLDVESLERLLLVIQLHCIIIIII